MENRKPSNKTYFCLLLLGALALLTLFYYVRTETYSLQIFCGVVYGIFLIFFVRRILIDLKARGSKWYGPVISALILLFILLLLALALLLDGSEDDNGFWAVLCAALLVLSFTLLLYRHLENKNASGIYSNKGRSQGAVPLEAIVGALNRRNEIEFNYEKERYLLIYEGGYFCFKRIVSADPFTYETLAKGLSAADCIGQAHVGGLPFMQIWADARDIKIYQ